MSRTRDALELAEETLARTKRMQTAADIPARLKAEIKAFLRASRWAGQTYRAIQANVAQRYNTSVDLHTIHDW